MPLSNADGPIRRRCATMPKTLPGVCSEAAEYGHPGTLASRCQPQLAFLTPLHCHRSPANNCGTGHRLASVASRAAGLGAPSERPTCPHSERTERVDDSYWRGSLPGRLRTVLKRPLRGADTPAAGVLANLGGSLPVRGPSLGHVGRPPAPNGSGKHLIGRYPPCSPGDEFRCTRQSLVAPSGERALHLTEPRCAVDSTSTYGLVRHRVRPSGCWNVLPHPEDTLEAGRSRRTRCRAAGSPRQIPEPNRHVGRRGD